MDKKLTTKYKLINGRKSLKFRYITVSSLETEESVNIGIIIEEDNKSPQIRTIGNIQLIHNFFPMFDIDHIDYCLKSIEIKYKLKKVKQERVYISKAVSISSPRLYNIDSHVDNLDQVLFNKFITLQKTQNIFYQVIKNISLFKKIRDSFEEENETINLNSGEIDTKFLFNERIENRFHMISKVKLKEIK